MCENIIYKHDSIDDQSECYNCIFNAICSIDLSSGFYRSGELSFEEAARIRYHRDLSNNDYEF